MIDRRKFALAATLSLVSLGVGVPTIAQAAKPETYASSSSNVAINGYDPVAYFIQKRPVKGLGKYSTRYKGALWRFSSQENKNKFVAMPGKFAPQYGGYCAYAVSYGSTAPTDPDAWTVVNGKLYLNNTVSVRTTWKKDIPENIKKANKNWPGVLR